MPLTVNTRPYAWVNPCSQHYLIQRGPGDVVPPPLEQDASAWVSAHGAVSAGDQFLEITVQGTGPETVVVDSLTVRTVGKGAPLAWNDYAMGYPGVGCGGGMPTRSFSVALDAARPALVPEAGHQDFPFTVSESDPEAYYVTADASAYYVRWYLELSWSSGSRHGTLTIDDKGRPFRTSGSNGRPDYEFPLGGSAWGGRGPLRRRRGRTRGQGAGPGQGAGSRQGAEADGPSSRRPWPSSHAVRVSAAAAVSAAASRRTWRRVEGVGRVGMGQA